MLLRERYENVAWEKEVKMFVNQYIVSYIIEYKIKKFGSILRNTAQISFSELYMERSSRRSEFFKSLKTLIHLEGWKKK
ncbi:MAG: hypothetical protein ACMUEL_06695 [Flavobacteriales bacterium Tduv]